MSPLRSLASGVALRVVTRLPGRAVGRARVSGGLAPVLELALAAVGSPLTGRVVAVAHGPAEGLKVVGERRSLAWLSGRVEVEVQSLLERELRPGGVFVDGGASIGFFSLLAARIVGPAGHVIAFEPQPSAAASVRRNALLNSFDHVVVVEAALSASTGRVMLHGVGTATARIGVAGDAGEGLSVDCVSLDDFLARDTRVVPSLVKIDVEGHEAAALAGMRSMLVEHGPALVIELHGGAAEVVDALEEMRYVVSIVGSDEKARDAEASAHLFARPSADRD